MKSSPIFPIFVVLALLLLWFWKPLAAYVGREHAHCEQKAKLITLNLYYPHFEYFAAIVEGKQLPKAEWMEGYYFGQPYIFHSYYQKAADLFPDVDAAHYLLAYCNYYMGDKAAARAEFEKSLGLDPYFFWSSYNLGAIYFSQGDYDKSAVILMRALALKPGATFDILHHDLYMQIWRYIPDTGVVVTNNMNEARRDAALLLADYFIKVKKYPEALQVLNFFKPADLKHQDLWQALYEAAANKHILGHEFDVLLQGQVPVRLF